MRPRKERTECDGQDRDFVVALARGLEILRAFRREGEALGNGDFAMRTGLSKSTVSRLTYNPPQARLSELESRHRALSTGAAGAFAGVLLSGWHTAAADRRPYMQELADHTGMPVALASPDRLTMVYLERCRGENAVTLAIEVGAHIKMATTAVGRAYLSVIPPEQRAALFEQLEQHEGAAWPEVRRGIEAAIECYQERGYCMSLTEWKPDVNAVAVALAPRDGSPVMAFNCGGPSQTLTRDWIESDVAPRLAELVRRVSAVTH